MKQLCVFAAGIVLVACAPTNEQPEPDTIGECSIGNKSVEQQRALKIASEYLQQHYPAMDVSKDCVEVYRSDRYWLVSYDPPLGSLGGGPQIKIDSTSFQVIDFLLTQ